MAPHSSSNQSSLSLVHAPAAAAEDDSDDPAGRGLMNDSDEDYAGEKEGKTGKAGSTNIDCECGAPCWWMGGCPGGVSLQSFICVSSALHLLSAWSQPSGHQCLLSVRPWRRARKGSRDGHGDPAASSTL